MVIRNPSEYQRLTEEFKEAVTAFLGGRTGTVSFSVDKGYKSAREALLGEIRSLERQLGFGGWDYNSSGFRKYYENLIKELGD